jgi:hypothetical protein
MENNTMLANERESVTFSDIYIKEQTEQFFVVH